jgi:hypothetical protein
LQYSSLTIFTLLLSVDSTFTQHVGEFVLLLLVATAGMMFLAGTQDLLIIFISLGTFESVAIHPRRLQQKQRAVLGSRSEVLSLSAGCRRRFCYSVSAFSMASRIPQAFR